MSSVYNNIKASLLKYCNDFIVVNSLAATFDVFDFDAHASLNDLPDKNILGIAEYGLMNEDHKYAGMVMIAVCTRGDDTNIQTLNTVIDKLFDDLRPGKIFSSVNSVTGTQIGNLKLKDTVEVFPVANTKGRPLQLIGISFVSTFLVPP